MPSPRQSDTLDALIERLMSACETPRSAAKAAAPGPHFTVYLENIGWAQLFEYDVNRYYRDAAFQLATQVEQRLYHWERFDDDTPLTTSFQAICSPWAVCSAE